LVTAVSPSAIKRPEGKAVYYSSRMLRMCGDFTCRTHFSFM
jgi:hypothetical protein